MKPTPLKTILECIPVPCTDLGFDNEAITESNSEDASNRQFLKFSISRQPSSKYAGGVLEEGREFTWTYALQKRAPTVRLGRVVPETTI
jgi:hypothetical protein